MKNLKIQYLKMLEYYTVKPWSAKRLLVLLEKEISIYIKNGTMMDKGTFWRSFSIFISD